MGNMKRAEGREERRMIEDGKLCGRCKRLFYAGKGPKTELFCRCPALNQFLNLRYELTDGVWRCDFLDRRTMSPLAKQRCFHHADSICEMVRRTPTRFNSEDRNLFEIGWDQGRGIVAIEVTPEQFLKLRP
jgi:hypothetical protein